MPSPEQTNQRESLFQRYFDQLAPHLPKGKEYKKSELTSEVDRMDVPQQVKYIAKTYCYHSAVRGDDGRVRVS